MTQPPISPPPSREQIRAALDRSRVPIYIIGALARVHPTRLGRMINGSLGLPPDVAVRVLRAIEDEAGSR